MGMDRSGQTVDDPLCSSSFAHLLKSIGSSPMDLQAPFEEWGPGQLEAPSMFLDDTISEDMQQFEFDDWADMPITFDDNWAQGGSPPPTNCDSSLASAATTSPVSSGLSLPSSPSPEPMHPLQMAPAFLPALPSRSPSPPRSPLSPPPQPPVPDPAPTARSPGKARRGIDKGMRRGKGLNFMGIQDQKALAAFAEVTPRWGYLLSEPGFEAGWKQVLVRQYHPGSGMVEVYCPLLQGASLTDRCRLLPKDRVPGLSMADQPTGTKLRGKKRPRCEHEQPIEGDRKRQRGAEETVMGPVPEGVPASAQASQELPWLKQKAPVAVTPAGNAPHTAPLKGIMGISLPPPRL